jgi:hypothetical protein
MHSTNRSSTMGTTGRPGLSSSPVHPLQHVQWLVALFLVAQFGAYDELMHAWKRTGPLWIRKVAHPPVKPSRVSVSADNNGSRFRNVLARQLGRAVTQTRPFSAGLQYLAMAARRPAGALQVDDSEPGTASSKILCHLI